MYTYIYVAVLDDGLNENLLTTAPLDRGNIYMCVGHICMYTYIYIYIYTYIHIYIYTYIHMYIYTYIYIALLDDGLHDSLLTASSFYRGNVYMCAGKIYIYIHTYTYIYIALLDNGLDENLLTTAPFCRGNTYIYIYIFMFMG